jgi:hypothetical protein
MNYRFIDCPRAQEHVQFVLGQAVEPIGRWASHTLNHPTFALVPDGVVAQQLGDNFRWDLTSSGSMPARYLATMSIVARQLSSFASGVSGTVLVDLPTHGPGDPDVGVHDQSAGDRRFARLERASSKDLESQMARAAAWYSAAIVLATEPLQTDWVALAVGAFDETSYILCVNADRVSAHDVRAIGETVWPSES